MLDYDLEKGNLMKTDFKSDWDECFQIHEDWWKLADVWQPLLLNRMFRGGQHPTTNWEMSASLHASLSESELEKLWTDIDSTIDRAENDMACRIYDGAAIPYYAPYLGPGTLGLVLGAKPIFTADSVWFEPCFSDISEAHVTFDSSNRWWKWTLDAAKQAMHRSNSRYLVAFPDIIEGLDCAAALLGTEKLLIAMLEKPSEVHRLLREISDSWYQAFDQYYAVVSPNNEGNVVAGFEIWGIGKTAMLQSDISAMLSPAMFEEFVAPHISEHASWLDFSLYHLDGPCALQHLDIVCGIDSINCIQWVPGDGAPWGHEDCWDAVNAKILDSGKSLWLKMKPEHVSGFVNKFGTRGVFLRLF